MSSYNVPFDFDGDKILYIDYMDNSVRSINIVKTLKQEKIFSFLIDKGFGHISHMKLLPDDCIFLCRNLCVCEIYNFKRNNYSYNQDNYLNVDIKDIHYQDNFNLLNTWVHKQNTEIIASNVYISGYKISDEYNNDKMKLNFGKNENSINSRNKKDNKMRLNFKKRIKNEIIDNINYNSIDSSSSKNKILDSYNKRNKDILNFEKEINNHTKIIGEENKEGKIHKKTNKRDNLKENYNESDNDFIDGNEEYYIITLDISGNFNIFINNGIKKTLFNLYKIENIEQKYKNLKFFSIGFPYFITINEYYYVITTDCGVFVISKNNND
jgi:hypothetical protein